MFFFVDNYFNNCCGLVLGLLITGATCTLLLLFLEACKISCLLWKFLIRCLLKELLLLLLLLFGGLGWIVPVGFVILLAGASGFIEWLARSGLDLPGGRAGEAGPSLWCRLARAGRVPAFSPVDGPERQS